MKRNAWFASLVFIGFIALVYANPPLRRGSDRFAPSGPLIITNGPAVEICLPDVVASEEGYCVVNLDTTATNKIFTSSFSATADTDPGWPVFGGQKDCFDWGAGVRTFVRQETAVLTGEVRCVRWR